MKLIKNPIFMFILGIIISGTTVFAVTQISASEIEYDNTHSVKDKIDDLYTTATTFKNLSQTTTATASDLLTGKTAYDNLGNLITGNISISDCVSGTYTKPANSNVNLVYGITATRVLISFFNPNGTGNKLLVYDPNINNYYVIGYTNNSPSITGLGGNINNLTNTTFTTDYDTNGATYKNEIDYYYIACK